ncbi:hypothetical protein [Nitrosomonas sp. Nm166]|uniref:hypothetical protein n=1 Tax=Nitrosomonas sp. Nm166 TaxID=1881054 RepID=UPI0008E77792|nr:hypothetical protein [Nitrosomonas sp. Nm166]SFE21090.1 hypothetical protein SAMN05428977_100962 [Nitrosomonas sp. Nm166]
MKMNRQALKKRSRTKLLWLLSTLLLGWSVAAGTVSASSVEEIVTALELNQDQLRRLHKGEIVAFEVVEATKKELAVGLSVYVAAPPEKLAAFFKQGDLATVDPDVVTYQEITQKSSSNPFKEFIFTSDQIDEARDLLSVSAGDEFNLSTEEIRSFAALKKNSTDWREADLIAAVSRHYQQILLNRLQEYRKRGLAGITPYARERKETNPAEELHIAAQNSKLLAQFSPVLQKFWLDYPAPLPPGTEERFFWLNRRVDDRPTAILSHRILHSSDTATVIITRQFFVGHSYNSSHLIVGCLPYRDGSIVIYTHRTSTDQVAGLGKKLKHNIGREQMKKQMMINLNGLRSAVQSSNLKK